MTLQNINCMKIIKDEQRLINLHPLVVYFMLPPEEYAKYGDNLKALNKERDFTHGVFKFQAFSLSEEYGNALPMALTESFKNYNMMVRLVDDAAGNFYYALHYVDFSTKPDAADVLDDYDLAESSMHSFIVDVCKQNVEHLNERLAKSATDSLSSCQNYTKMRDVFQHIALQQDFKHGVWERINTSEKYCIELEKSEECRREEEKLRRLENSKLLRSIHLIRTKVSKAVDRLTQAGLSTDQAELAVETLWSIIETEFNTPDEETSDEIAKGTVDKDYSSYIRRDQTTRFKPQTEPKVSAAIKRISVGVLKNGHERLHWGVEFQVNDEFFPIYFGSKHQTMIYVCTLLRAKLGEKLYLHEFFNNSKGLKSKFQRKKSMCWLEKVFYTIYPSMHPPFEDWMQKIQDEKNPGRPLNQGKSQAVRKVQEALEEQPDGRYYCVIDTRSDANGDSYYNIRIKPENIMIPEKMQYLVDEFYDMMGIKAPKISSQHIKE